MKIKKTLVFTLVAAVILTFTIPAGLSEAATGTDDSDNVTEIQTGFVTENGKTYYYDENGDMVHGFLTIDNSTYFFGKYGTMLTGFRIIKGDKYYFNENGKMARGWKTVDGNRYYFKKGKALRHGPYKIKGNVYTFSGKGVLIRTVYKDKKAVCLTYDDGPSANTMRIVNTLKKNDGLATFFVVGTQIDSFSSTLKKTAAAGNQIGNHSWNHVYYNPSGDSRVKYQTNKCTNKAKSYGVTMKVARTPGGFSSGAICKDLGMPNILWSIDTLDWKTRNASKTYNCVVNNVRDGDIVLMHDLHKQTADAAVKLIPKLRKMGYQLVTIEEMSMLKNKPLKAGKTYHSFR